MPGILKQNKEIMHSTESTETSSSSDVETELFIGPPERRYKNFLKN